MANIVIMPKQGLQMTEGTITKWLVKENDTISEGESLFEMETDKLTITIPSGFSGTILKLLYSEGDTIPITKPIAIIGDTGEDISSLDLEIGEVEELKIKETLEVAENIEPVKPQQEDKEDRIFISPRAKMMATESGLDYLALSGSGPEGLIVQRDITAALKDGKALATPLARKTAEITGVNISQVVGSGFNGKVLEADIHKAKRIQTDSNTANREELIPISSMRSVIAKRMKDSLLTMAQANHKITVDMSEVVLMRKKLKKLDVKYSYNDFVLRCVAKALCEFPMINASWSDEGIILKKYINLGVAVAVENGLIVPVIKDADKLSLLELSEYVGDLSKRAKENSLANSDYCGGTFTVSNLGMYNIDSFTAIINPPEAGILAVGKISKQPVVIDDEIVIRDLIQLSLTYDHRIVDGAPAASFLNRIKVLLENPGLLI